MLKRFSLNRHYFTKKYSASLVINAHFLRTCTLPGDNMLFFVSLVLAMLWWVSKRQTPLHCIYEKLLGMHPKHSSCNVYDMLGTHAYTDPVKCDYFFHGDHNSFRFSFLNLFHFENGRYVIAYFMWGMVWIHMLFSVCGVHSKVVEGPELPFQFAVLIARWLRGQSCRFSLRCW